MCDRCYCMDAIIKSCMTFEKTNFLKDLHTIHYFTLEAQPYPNRNSKRIVATHNHGIHPNINELGVCDFC